MHTFIEETLRENFEEDAVQKIKDNNLIRYINDKTASYNKDSKSRANYGALYAIYVVVEDYIDKNYHLRESNYEIYEGAQYHTLFDRMRELPYGKKLQNHYLNNRVNSEFSKRYKDSGEIIIRNQQTQRYWINEELLLVEDNNIAELVIQLIDRYVSLRNSNFEKFRETIDELKKENNIKYIMNFVNQNISENADARRFEIISFSILKNYYKNFEVWYGEEENSINKINPTLFKTGRTNANDGGIDFILLPLGKIYQVTESLNFKKYFLDIDKLNRYPISFVVKIDEDESFIRETIIESAKSLFEDRKILNKYISCIDEIFTIKNLRVILQELYEQDEIESVLDDIIKEAEVEFNYEVEAQ